MPRRILISIATLAAAVIGLVACGGPASPPVPQATAMASPDELSPDEVAQLQAFFTGLALQQWVDAVWAFRAERQLDPTLVCLRHRESDRGPYPHTNGYDAVSSGGRYHGAYQFLPSTWNSTAAAAGRPDLVGVLPSHAEWYDQDELALALLSWQGLAPWGGSCR